MGWCMLRPRPQLAAKTRATGAVHVRLACTYCKGEGARSELAFCGACLAPHHRDCFAEHGRCSVQGCAGEAVIEPRRPEDRPVPATRGRAHGANQVQCCLVGLGMLVVLGVFVFAALLLPLRLEGQRGESDLQQDLSELRYENDAHVRYEAELERKVNELSQTLQTQEWLASHRVTPREDGAPQGMASPGERWRLAAPTVKFWGTLYTQAGPYALIDGVLFPVGSELARPDGSVWTVEKVRVNAVTFSGGSGYGPHTLVAGVTTNLGSQ